MEEGGDGVIGLVLDMGRLIVKIIFHLVLGEVLQEVSTSSWIVWRLPGCSLLVLRLRALTVPDRICW